METTNRKLSLVDQHKAALEIVTEPNLDRNKSELHSLRRRRMYLSSVMKEMQTKRTLSVGDELRARAKRWKEAKRRCFLQRIPVLSSEVSENRDSSIVESAVNEKHLAHRMAYLRHQRKLAAAYRLSGISFLRCTDDVVALRFDICISGRYVNCFFTFFDIVCSTSKTMGNTRPTSDTDDLLYLRLAQHTLPASIPLSTILHDTLKGVTLLGSATDKTSWATSELLDKLRKCSQLLYHACYCYSVRQTNVDILRELGSQESSLRDERYYVTEDVQSSDCYEKLTFQVKLLSGACTMSFKLVYKDALRVFPTSVTACNLTSSNLTSRRRSHQREWPSVSDSEESAGINATDDLIETSAILFRRHEIPRALTEVAALMVEW